jgi:hypothetical protein
MLLKRCRGSAWLKALVSKVCNLPLLRFSSEICSPQQSNQIPIRQPSAMESKQKTLGLVTDREMVPHETRIGLLPEHVDGHIGHHEHQHRPVRRWNKARPSGETEIRPKQPNNNQMLLFY